MLKVVGLFFALVSWSGQAAAAWHVEELGSDMVIVGVGETDGGVLNFLSMRCAQGRLTITADSMIPANDDEELSYYSNLRARFEYGGPGERKEMTVDARASRNIGEVMTIVVALDPDQSRLVMKSITAGNRMAFTPIHPEISVEDNAFNVLNFGFTAVLFAVDKKCLELLRKQ